MLRLNSILSLKLRAALIEKYHAVIGNVTADLRATSVNTYKTILCQLHFVLQRPE
jgi:hypothetical protein